MQGLRVGQIEEQKTLLAALDSGYITNWSVAIDGGAHVGGWSKIMAERFETVHAFEPAADTFKILQGNMADVPKVRLYQMALMEKAQFGVMERTKARTTSRLFTPKPGGDVVAVAIDDLPLPSLGLLKLDLEGCELFALKGAETTIKRHWPFLIVEMAASLNKGLSERFGVSDADVARWLKTVGYREVFRVGVNVGFASTYE